MPVIALREHEVARRPGWMRHALLVAALARAGEEGAEAAVPTARLGIPLTLPRSGGA